MLGTPVDLSKVDVDSYVVAGVADHICPWQNCYRSTGLLGGTSPLRALDERPHRRAGQPAGQPEGDVLASTSRARRTRRSGSAPPTPCPGTWWTDHVQWLAERSGEPRPAPAELGGGGLRPLDPAPGTYVLER